MKAIEEGANKKALRSFAKFLAVFIIMSVAIFGDTMYYLQMQKIFAGNGLLQVFCLVGAFTSVLAVGYLLLGKSAVFEPGGQMLMSWIAFAVEMIVIALNIMVVFNHDKTGPMAAWATISPATPVVHMLLIGLVYFMDPELKEAHLDKELQRRQRDAERKQAHMLTNARVSVKEKHIERMERELETVGNSPESQARISQYAQSMNDAVLTEMSGRSLPVTVESDDIYDSRSERGFGRR